MLPASPGIEPTAPEFHTEGGIVRADRFADLEGGEGTGAEVQTGGRAFNGTAPEHQVPVGGIAPEGDAVRREERNGDSGVAVEVAEIGQVFFVAGIGAVFVFHLHGNDGTAFIELQRFEFGNDHIHVVREGVDIGLVHAAVADPGLLHEPRWQPAVIPFGTDVGTGAHDHIKSHFLCEADIRFKIQHAGEIEIPFRAFMQVPAHVSLDPVQTELDGFFHAVPPVFPGNAEIVHGAGDDLYRLAIDDHGTVSEFHS